MAPTSKSKKPSQHDADSDDDRPSSSRKSSSSSKKPEKKENTSLLKSMFTKDRSEAPSSKSSSSKSGRLDSAMFSDESRVVKSEKVRSERVKNEKIKSEKKKPEKILEEEYAEEPDFEGFQSKWEAPKEVKKVAEKKEKKPEKKPEKKREKSRYESAKYESKAEPSAKYESAKYESRKAKSKVAKSNLNFKTTFTSDHDREMAVKQTQIAELSGEELVKQEEWAFEKLRAHAGTCPMGFNWIRHTVEAVGQQEFLDGYRCRGRSHFVSHQMVAAGEGRVMLMTDEYSSWDVQTNTAPYRDVPPPPPFTGVKWELIAKVESDDESRAFKARLMQMRAARGPANTGRLSVIYYIPPLPINGQQPQQQHPGIGVGGTFDPFALLTQQIQQQFAAGQNNPSDPNDPNDSYGANGRGSRWSDPWNRGGNGGGRSRGSRGHQQGYR